MNDDLIVATSVVSDELMVAAGHRGHVLARVSDAEVLTVAAAAAAFQHRHARALQATQGMGHPSRRLSASRFNRRLHARAPWLEELLEVLGTLCATGEASVLASLPLPACRRGRARRCRKVQGRPDGGDRAAKREPSFGWRLHRVATPAGGPVACALPPGGLRDPTPVHDLTGGSPPAASVYADKAYDSAEDEASILADTGVRSVPIRKAHMRPHPWADELALREHRHRIETSHSQLAAMGGPRLHARPNPGFAPKVHASLVALTAINAF